MTRVPCIAAAVSLALALAAGPAQAGQPPSGLEATRSECSACHMAYPPAFLPERSWHAIMVTLDDHFGEDASLDETTRAAIEQFLVANAADAGGRRSGALWGISPDETPLRITEMPWFVSQHRYEVPQWMRDRAASMSNCTACHRFAGSGSYDDD